MQMSEWFLWRRSVHSLRRSKYSDVDRSARSAWGRCLYRLGNRHTKVVMRVSCCALSAGRESVQVYAGPDGLCTSLSYRTALIKCGSLSLLWTVTGYVCVRGLRLMSGIDAVALFATQSNFDYVLSWIVLQKNFVALRVSEKEIHWLSICFEPGGRGANGCTFNPPGWKRL